MHPRKWKIEKSMNVIFGILPFLFFFVFFFPFFPFHGFHLLIPKNAYGKILGNKSFEKKINTQNVFWTLPAEENLGSAHFLNSIFKTLCASEFCVFLCLKKSVRYFLVNSLTLSSSLEYFRCRISCIKDALALFLM